MSITPLYSLDEINAEITQAKADLAAARRMQSYAHNSRQREVQRERVKELQNHLEWMQQQRMQIEGAPGLQSILGTVPRG